MSVGEWIPLTLESGVHIIGCPSCTPELVLEGPRKSENHFSIRFGDHLSEVRYRGDVVMNVVEVMAGPGGWALTYIDVCDIHRCWQTCNCGSLRPAMEFFESDEYSVRTKVKKP